MSQTAGTSVGISLALHPTDQIQTVLTFPASTHAHARTRTHTHTHTNTHTPKHTHTHTSHTTSDALRHDCTVYPVLTQGSLARVAHLKQTHIYTELYRDRSLISI